MNTNEYTDDYSGGGEVRHPTGRELMEYMDGTLPTQQRTQVAQHIIACPSCTSDLAFRSSVEQAAHLQMQIEPLPGFTDRVMKEIHGIHASQPSLLARIRARVTVYRMVVFVCVTIFLEYAASAIYSVLTNPDTHTERIIPVTLGTGVQNAVGIFLKHAHDAFRPLHVNTSDSTLYVFLVGVIALCMLVLFDGYISRRNYR